MPIVHTRIALNPLKEGDTLLILADDPTFAEEFRRFAVLADIELIKKETLDTHESYLVKVLR